MRLKGIQLVRRPGTRVLSEKYEDGQALVETALSIVILLTFLFGIFEVSLAAYTYHFLSEAAREGTRYAIVRGNTCTGFPSACPATTAQIKSYVLGLNYPGIDSSKMAVNVNNYAFPAGTTCSPSASCNNAGNEVQVQVQYAFPFAVPFVPSSTINMSSTSEMVIAH
jgi:Flp pilus assembly protein TadG